MDTRDRLGLPGRARRVAGRPGRCAGWTGRTFFTRPDDLERLWADVDVDAGELTVVMEPTRNAWAPVAAWFNRRGAKVVLVPTTQSADLRAYYSKHTKNDRLDSTLLARLPLLHPEGLRAHTGPGPPTRCVGPAKQRSSIVKRRTAVFARIDALLELLGRAGTKSWGPTTATPRCTCWPATPTPPTLIRLGPTRLARFLIRYSHGPVARAQGRRPDPVARESLPLWDREGMDFAALAADIAIEAEQALN